MTTPTDAALDTTHPHTCQDCGAERTCTEDDARFLFQRCDGCYVKWGTE